MQVIRLTPVPGCHIRMMSADAIALANEIERRGWDLWVASGQLMVKTNGQRIPKDLTAQIKAEKASLVRLVAYCEAIT